MRHAAWILIFSLFLALPARAAGPATQCIVTLKKVEMKTTTGDWKTVFQGDLPMNWVAPEEGPASVTFKNQCATDENFVGIRLTIDETVAISGRDGSDAFTKEGGEVEIRGTAGDLEALPGEYQSIEEKSPSYSVESAGVSRVIIDYDYADRDRTFEMGSRREFETVLAAKPGSDISVSLKVDLEHSVIHLWPDYYPGFPKVDVMIFDFPKQISEFSVKIDGRTAFVNEKVYVKF